MAKLMVQRLGKQLYRQFPSLWGPTQLGFSSHMDTPNIDGQLSGHIMAVI